MVKNITILCTLFFASLCWGQYSQHTTQAPGDLSPNLPTVNAWKLLPGGGTCTLPTLSVGDDGYIACLGTDNPKHVWTYSTESQTWSWAFTDTTVKTLAVQTGSAIWVLKADTPGTGCNADSHNPPNLHLYLWTNGAFVAKTGCATQVSVAPDGTILTTNWQGTSYRSTDGVNWTAVTGPSSIIYVSSGDSTHMCAVAGGHVYTLVGSSFSQLAAQPTGTAAGCSMAQGKHPIFLSWNTTGSVRTYSAGVWSLATGLTASQVATSTKGLTFAVTSSGVPYHLNIFAWSVSGNISGSMPGGCPPPQACAGGATHTGNEQTWLPGGLYGSLGTQTLSPSANMNVSSMDVGPACDPFVGNPNDPACTVAVVGSVHCNASNQDIFTAINPLRCVLNIVPPDVKLDFPLPHPPRGWSSPGGPVLVYINSNNYPNGSLGYTAICNGIKSWAVGNFKTYTCLSTNGVPSPEPSSDYIYVSQGGNRSSTDPCGPPPYYNPPSSCPGSDHTIHRDWMQIDNTAITSHQIQGNAAHEEGHNNFMKDCGITCQDHGSVMGSGSTDAANQLLGPTDCDIFYYLYYNKIW